MFIVGDERFDLVSLSSSGCFLRCQGAFKVSGRIYIYIVENYERID